VRLFARRWGGPRGWPAGVSIICFLLTGCSRQEPQAAPDAVSQLQAVAPADPAKFPVLQESKHWSNPYLVVRPAAVGLLTDVAAWPYGRAVAILVDAKATSSEQDKIALRRNRGIVAGELQSAHVAISWIPSS
jgi:hypothetical protein